MLRPLLLPLAYTLTALPCLYAAARARHTPRTLWLLLAALLLLAAADKSLGLLHTLTDTARQFARESDLYALRRTPQKAALQLLPLLTLTTLILLSRPLRRLPPRDLSPLIPILFLTTLLATRAISHHRIDYITRTRYAGLTLTTCLDLTALALTLATLLIATRHRTARPTVIPPSADRRN